MFPIYYTALNAQMLVNVILYLKDGEAADANMFRPPFDTPGLALDWHCPGNRIL